MERENDYGAVRAVDRLRSDGQDGGPYMNIVACRMVRPAEWHECKVAGAVSHRNHISTVYGVAKIQRICTLQVSLSQLKRLLAPVQKMKLS